MDWEKLYQNIKERREYQKKTDEMIQKTHEEIQALAKRQEEDRKQLEQFRKNVDDFRKYVPYEVHQRPKVYRNGKNDWSVEFRKSISKFRKMMITIFMKLNMIYYLKHLNTKL